MLSVCLVATIYIKTFLFISLSALYGVHELFVSISLFLSLSLLVPVALCVNSSEAIVRLLVNEKRRQTHREKE